MTGGLFDALKGQAETLLDSIGGRKYVCPSCGREEDVEAVRSIVERGEAPTCDCGEIMLLEDGE